MIEERESRIPLGTRVKVLNTDGIIYERNQSEGHTIYGVQFKQTVWPNGFGATRMWHCMREELEIIEPAPPKESEKV